MLFFRTNVSATTPPGNTDLVAKALVSVGGRVVVPTRRVALPGVPGPPLVDDAVALFTLSPGVVAVTVTVIEQVELIARVAPERVMRLEPALASSIPPQVVTALLGVAMISPAGNGSFTLTPVNATMFAGGLVMIKVRTEVPPTRMEDGEKDLLIEGGAMTVRSATAGSPGFVLEEVIVLEMLCFSPALVPVTVTIIGQVALPPSTPPVSEMVVEVTVRLPPQIAEMPVGLATRPSGRVSLNATPVTPAEPGLVRLNVNVEVEFTGMLIGRKALVMSNLGGVTDKVAVEVFPVPPLVEDTVTLLTLSPRVTGVTLMVMVQDEFTPTVPPLKDTKLLPGKARTLPPQVLVARLGLATCNPAGKVSRKLRPIRASVLAGSFVITKDMVDNPF